MSKDQLFSSAFLPLLSGLKWRKAGRRSPEARIKKEVALLERSGLFDRHYYLEMYPDVAQSGMEPLRHYVAHGAAENRDPNPYFDTAFYLKANRDVAEVGVNPLRHYDEFGWREFRQPSPLFDARYYFLIHCIDLAVPINPLTHYLQEGRAAGLSVPAFEETTSADLTRMSNSALAFLAKAKREHVELDRLKLVSAACIASGFWNHAEAALQQIVIQQPGSGEDHAALANCQARQQKWWMVEQSMARAVQLGDSKGDWLLVLADAQERMGHLNEAQDTFRRALALNPQQANLHYRLGYVLERAGNQHAASDAYAQALELTDDTEVKACGVGVFHQQRGFWEDARNAFADEVRNRPLEAALRYHLGMTHDRLYDWAAAEECYVAAIALSPQTTRPQWNFRLGYVRERQGRFSEAADAYGAAISLSNKHVRYWQYRLGYVLEAAGDLERACESYRQLWQQTDISDATWLPDDYFKQFDCRALISEAIRDDATRPEWHFELGACCQRVGDPDGAIKAYMAALARAEDHEPKWFYNLGCVLADSGRFEDACEAFRQTRVLQRPHGCSEKRQKTTPSLRVETTYVEYSECLPVQEKTILYESFNGNSLTCSPLGLFRTLIDHPDYKDYLHVWVLNDKSRIPEDLRPRSNVVFVKKVSDGYLRHIATAKYLINNSGFPPYFIRRSEQRYLATWHGTPLKTLGKEQKYKFYDHKRTQRNFLQASHLITPNPHTTGITLDSYDIRQLATGMVAETGYPRIDLTLNADEERKRYLRERLGLEDGKPVVLYAPTWRGTLEDVQFDSSRLESDLEALAQQGGQLLFRGHSLLEGVLRNEDLDCAVVPGDIDTNELLSIVDVLITDYSSVFFDFIATNKPILYYIYDVEEYERDRGMYFSMDEMPGYKCRTIEELCSALNTAFKDGVADEVAYAEARAKYNLHDDGLASQRVIDFFFNDNAELAMDYRKADRHSVVLSGGSFTPNGITTSFLNLVNNIDRSVVDVVVAFSPNTVESLPGNIEQFYRLPDDIYAVPRYGRFPMTLEEGWLKKLHDQGVSLSPPAEAILKHAYTREFTRIFGFKHFDTAVSFAGYDAFWTAVLVANDLPMRKAIYLHNNMYAEYESKYPELIRMFDLYGMADKLVSVSDQTNELNKQNLSGRYGLPEALFDYCDNLTDPATIAQGAEADLEFPQDEALFETEGPVFINLARLSVEKDHEKLIRAFASVVAGKSSARLLILGTGPLEPRLREVIAELSLADSVHLLGFRSNPYPYLQRADCFVLSSNHEGQPMTLLEALVLGKPIVATDIVGNRSVLQDRPGLLVPNSIDGLVDGMQSFIADVVPAGKFDAEAYQRNAIAMFNQRVLGMD